MNRQLERQNQEVLYDEMSNRTAAENVDIFLRRADLVDSFENMDSHTRRIVIDVPLQLQLDELDAPEDPQSERDELVTFFEGLGWFPVDRQEAASLIPEDLVLSTVKRPYEARTKAAKEIRLAEIRTRLQDATADEEVFAKVGVRPGISSERKAKWLRDSREAQYMLADKFMQKEFLNRGDWPQDDSLEQYHARSFWRGYMLMAAKYASDETLNSTLDYFFKKAQERRAYYSKLYSMEAHVLGKSAIIAGGAPKPEIKQSAAYLSDDSWVPESARPAMDRHLEEFGADMERVDKQAQTTSNGIDAHSRAKVITEEDRSEKEILDITKRAYSIPSSPSHRRRLTIKQANIKRHFGETGPSDKAKGEI